MHPSTVVGAQGYAEVRGMLLAHRRRLRVLQRNSSASTAILQLKMKQVTKKFYLYVFNLFFNVESLSFYLYNRCN